MRNFFIRAAVALALSTGSAEAAKDSHPPPSSGRTAPTTETINTFLGLKETPLKGTPEFAAGWLEGERFVWSQYTVSNKLFESHGKDGPNPRIALYLKYADTLRSADLPPSIKLQAVNLFVDAIIHLDEVKPYYISDSGKDWYLTPVDIVSTGLDMCGYVRLKYDLARRVGIPDENLRIVTGINTVLSEDGTTKVGYPHTFLLANADGKNVVLDIAGLEETALPHGGVENADVHWTKESLYNASRRKGFIPLIATNILGEYVYPSRSDDGHQRNINPNGNYIEVAPPEAMQEPYYETYNHRIQELRKGIAGGGICIKGSAACIDRPEKGSLVDLRTLVGMIDEALALNPNVSGPWQNVVRDGVVTTRNKNGSVIILSEPKRAKPYRGSPTASPTFP